MTALTPRLIGIGLAVLLVAAMALATTYKDSDAPKTTAGGREAFVPAKYGVMPEILKPGAESSLRFSGHQLPTLTHRTKFAGGHILLVGDAAGLVQPDLALRPIGLGLYPR